MSLGGGIGIRSRLRACARTGVRVRVSPEAFCQVGFKTLVDTISVFFVALLFG